MASGGAGGGGGAFTVDQYGPQIGIISPNPYCDRGVAAILSASPDGLFIAYANGSIVIVRSVKVGGANCFWKCSGIVCTEPFSDRPV